MIKRIIPLIAKSCEESETGGGGEREGEREGEGEGEREGEREREVG